MDDRKYRQQGYRSAGESRGKREPPPPSSSPAATLKSRAVSRCAECGAVLPVTAASMSECPSCRAALHACRQCGHFDPGQRFECTEAVPERIADKRAGNECASFSLRVSVERDASGGGIRPDDARRSFQNLFKK